MLTRIRALLGTTLASLVVVACEASRPLPVDEARLMDDAALVQARLEKGSVAVVADGMVTQVGTVEEAILLAGQTPPRSRHAYIAVGGQESFRRWEISAPCEAVTVIGNDALAKLIDKVEVDPAGKLVTLEVHGEKVCFPFKEGLPVVPLRIRAATNPRGFRDVDVLVASGFSHGLLLSPQAATTIGLETSEQPGITEVAIRGTDRSADCHRGLVYVEIQQLHQSALVDAVTPMYGAWR